MTPLSAVAVAPAARCCRHCSEELPRGAQSCPSCMRRLAAPEDTSNVYDLEQLEAEIPAEWQPFPVYTLESPVRCPHCRESIRTVRIIGLTRTQVSFTSTLPRRGRMIVCPECERVLSAELSGLV